MKSLDVLGLALVSAAGFTVSIGVGLALAGVAVLAVSWALSKRGS